MKTQPLIYIDGEAGTTGLQLHARLEGRKDLRLLRLGDARRDVDARREALNTADLSVLCLPDEAARESVAMVDNPDAKILDASTAHRVAPGWVYGFPEYDRARPDEIASAKRVANPGCHAVTAIALIYPLIKAGVLPPDWPVSVQSVTGYSGGGKGLIASFEDPEASDPITASAYLYGLSLNHKHMPEITKWAGLESPPVFLPVIGRFHQGMAVSLPLSLSALPGKPAGDDILAVYQAHYPQEQTTQNRPSHVRVVLHEEAPSRLEPEAASGRDDLTINLFVSPDKKRALVVGMLDNLGKGAAGQAVQNIDLMLGLASSAHS